MLIGYWESGVFDFLVDTHLTGGFWVLVAQQSDTHQALPSLRDSTGAICEERAGGEENYCLFKEMDCTANDYADLAKASRLRSCGRNAKGHPNMISPSVDSDLDKNLGAKLGCLKMSFAPIASLILDNK